MVGRDGWKEEDRASGRNEFEEVMVGYRAWSTGIMETIGDMTVA